MKTFKTLSEFKAAHKAAGLHFFERSTMRFFNSRIESGLLSGLYFITSEQFDTSYATGNRLYTVRKINTQTLQIDTIGQFQQFASLSRAKLYVKNDVQKDKLSATK